MLEKTLWSGPTLASLSKDLSEISKLIKQISVFVTFSGSGCVLNK